MYESGLFFAFCLWMFHAVNLLVQINSTLNKNLHKVGKRLSWLTLKPESLDHSHLEQSAWWKAVKYVALQVVSLPLILLSWLYVGISVVMIIFGRMKDSGRPQAFKEFEWKMKNIDMSFDQILGEIAKSQGLSEAQAHELREATLDEMEQACLIPKRNRDPLWQDTE